VNTPRPAEQLLGFIHHLRDEGYPVGVREARDIFSILDKGCLSDKRYSKYVIRALSCHSPDEWQRFDDLFAHYWFPPNGRGDTPASGRSGVREHPRSAVTGFGGNAGQSADELGDTTGVAGSGAGRQRTLSKADFRFLNDRRAMSEVERLAERLAHEFKLRLRRRTLYQTHGTRLAIRQTIRRNLSCGGMPVKPFFRFRPREPAHVVILQDVSHSMAWNNPLLFRFARGIARAFKKSEVFAFHTRLFRVTEFYREQSLTVMKRRLEDRNHLWLGGTCIAESIEKFNRLYAGKTLTPRTIFVIISDGFDTNEPEHLAQELSRIKKSVYKTIWMNPMLGREGYEPNRDSMAAAMPYLDRLFPAHSLDSLKQTVDYVASVCHRN
jgi:uncharacterized protein